MKNSIQIQLILYNNRYEEIRKTISSIRNSLIISNKFIDLDDISVVCGDSSENMSLTKEEINSLSGILGENVDFKYQFFDMNTGYGKGHNLLAKECNYEYLLIMNPDILLSPRFFLEILDPFSNNDVGMVEARQTPVEHQKEYNIDTGETEWAVGACIMVRTDIYHKLNGFDSDSFFMYCEDVDFSWRMRLLGYKIIYQPLAVVFHAKRLSNTGNWMPTDIEIYYSAVSSLMMAYKWSGDDELNRLKMGYAHSANELHRKAVTYFEKIEKTKLPEKLDEEHKIARFLNGYYSENRYII